MNKIFISGNLTKDPDCAEQNDGKRRTKFSIAVRRNYKNKDGEYDVDFFDCFAWGQNADVVSNYVRKGDRILVEGIVQIRKYQDNNSVWQKALEVLVDRVELISNRAHRSGDFAGNFESEATPRKSQSSEDTPTRRRTGTVQGIKKEPKIEVYDDDGDIPF